MSHVSFEVSFSVEEYELVEEDIGEDRSFNTFHSRCIVVSWYFCLSQ